MKRVLAWGGALALAVALAPVTAAHADPVERCKLNVKSIGELSGLASDGSKMYATNDGGTKVSVSVLSKDCKVERTITNKLDPFDVEDMAVAKDGTIWLSDTGDNSKKRETVALIALKPNGNATLYRLTYPDGQHDAEALLLDQKGVPYIVTKEPFGPAEVYRPEGELASPGPTKLTKVGSVDFKTTETPGGPTRIPHAIATVLVTGGAVSADGKVVALRTYTDAYLFSAPDGDIAAALKREPVRVGLPDEPQGETIAFEPDGTLLTGSEGVGQPIRTIAGATGMVSPNPQGGNSPGNSGGAAGDANAASATSDSGFPSWLAIIIGVIVVLGGLAFMARKGTSR
ncbi:hypothetical protein LWC34_42970 [Kibdelosporangium philippinense]|uniref:Esterase-like activity of phytase family protein n=1 Tax=Kibdelosporangium philippinense TaxID=211113 RepID=A0ABS8ZP42_9PSEU|nr:hypothetical protein [Kibdelosporangium philippinense]MCE7009526.1 hypothetical protein [Kibdelosporangium philippinense]